MVGVFQIAAVQTIHIGGDQSVGLRDVFVAIIKKRVP